MQALQLHEGFSADILEMQEKIFLLDQSISYDSKSVLIKSDYLSASRADRLKLAA